MSGMRRDEKARRPLRVVAWGSWGASVILAVALGATVLDTRNLVLQQDPFALLAFTAAGLGYGSVALIIALNRPANSLHWILRVVGLGLPALGLVVTLAIAWAGDPDRAAVVDLLMWTSGWAYVVILPAITLLPLLFPTGHSLTPRWNWVAYLALVTMGLLILTGAFGPVLGGGPVVRDNPFGLKGTLGDVVAAIGAAADFLVILAVGLSAAGLVARMRRSRGVEREQIKWLAYAAAITAIGIGLSIPLQMLAAVLPPFAAEIVRGPIRVMAIGGYTVLVPISVGIAILRYRLYDIDVLINRTLVYGATVALLGLAYFAGLMGLQTLLRPLGSEVAVAGATLIAVVLFQPIRSRIQRAVDRRFYRAKYDAERTLDAFSARLRSEVDLGALKGDLLEVVHETLRPLHASLWLREAQR
jgi:hypothetical protein